MKSLIVIFAFGIFGSFALQCQDSKSIQLQLDSLSSRISFFERVIQSYLDSIKYVEKTKVQLSDKLVEAIIAEHEAAVNVILGPKGFNTKVHETVLREKPYVSSGKIKTIKADGKVLVLSLEKFPYYKVKHQGKIGYVYFSSIKFGLEIDAHNKELERLRPTQENIGSQSTGSSNRYVPSPSNQNPSASSSAQSGCRSVQCSGTTKKGVRCKNRTTNCNGRCYRH